LSYLASRVRLNVFDTEPAPGVLKRFYPDAKLADVSDVPGQMQIVDTLKRDVLSVVDVRAGSLSKTLADFLALGLVDEVKEKKIKLCVVHVLDNTIASLAEICNTDDQLIDAPSAHVLVKNYKVKDAGFFEWDAPTYEAFFKSINPAGPLVIPNLNSFSCEAADKAGGTFDAFIANEAQSWVLRRYVQDWLKKVFAEFERGGLGSLIA
jgi:hypothetical protein